jgi:hypothetical protein
MSQQGRLGLKKGWMEHGSASLKQSCRQNGTPVFLNKLIQDFELDYEASYFDEV